jgi:ABC-2 type transport system permease protein
VISVLLRLQWMTTRGRVVRGIRLLRQPKYLVGTVIGACWVAQMALWTGGPLVPSDAWSHYVSADGLSASLLSAAHKLAGVALTMLLGLTWLFPWGRLGLPFREAELTLLLQAPLTRRELIHYGVLKSALGVFIGSLAAALLLGAGGPLEHLRLFLGMWLLFGFWDLHTKWRGLFLLRQREVPPGVARVRRALLTLGVGSWLLALAVAGMRFSPRVIADVPDWESFAGRVGTVPWPPLLLALSLPARWLAAPVFATDWPGFALAALPVAAMIAVQRELVLRTPARFEESALARAKDAETRKSPARRFKRASSRGRRQQVFPLSGAGEPSIAIVWKNLMRVARVPLAHSFAAVAALLALVGVVPALLGLHQAVYVIIIVVGLVSALASPILGGMTWNNDLRTEFGHIEMVRTWPVSAARFVAGQVASPALLSFLTSCVGLGLALAGFMGSRLRVALTDLPPSVDIGGPSLPLASLGSGAVLLIVAGLLPLLASVAFVSSALQNLVVVLAPAWLAQGSDTNKGIAAFGRHLVFGMVMFPGLVLALIPGAALVALAALAQWALGMPWAAWVAPLWGLLVAAPLFAEGWLLVKISAGVWEALDPAAEILDSGR